MSLKTWLRDWLDVPTKDQMYALDLSIDELSNKVNVLIAHHDALIGRIQKLEELLKMPTDFRLAQAKNSLNLLTEFINEIQRDQMLLEHKLRSQLDK